MPEAIDSNLLRVHLGDDPELTVNIAAAGQLWLPMPVLAEAWFTVVNSRRRRENANRLEICLRPCIVPPITEFTSLYYAQIRFNLQRTGRPISMNDMWIAAACREHELTLATRDRYFDHVEGLTALRW